MHAQIALITLLTILLIGVAAHLVGLARTRFQILAPSTTGNAEFERVFRAHQNTLEATVMFLPALWVAAVYCDEFWVAMLGYAWLVGRAWYLAAYAHPSGKRGSGFMIAIVANAILVVWALVRIVPLLAG
jgi:glutathione S-transferase